MKKLFTSLLLGLGLFYNSSAQVIDQSNENIASVNGTAEPRYTSAIFSYAQSFVAGKSGEMSAFSFRISSVTSSGTFKLSLVEGSGFSGNVLSEEFFQVFLNETPLNEFYKVTFNSPAEITEGNPYSIVFTPVSANGHFGINITPDTEYANGTMFFLNSNVGTPSALPRDIIFRTYVFSCETTSSTTNISNCNPISWNGQTYSETGIYQKTLVNTGGCDSIATLNFTRNLATSSTSSATACDSYEWNGKTYTESGEYTVNGLTYIDYFEIFEGFFEPYEAFEKFVNSKGCDSTATLNLTINKSKEVSEEITVCKSYEWNDITYDESGIYKQKFTSSQGCDSTVTLDLTIERVIGETENISTCGSYEWHGEIYTEGGNYEEILTAQDGCDSIAKLSLSFKTLEGETESIISCGAYEWNEEIYDKSGFYEITLTSTDGCDSIAYLDLTIKSSIEFTEEFMYNECTSDISFSSDADSVVLINGKELIGKNLNKWSFVWEFSSTASNQFNSENSEGEPDGKSWAPNPLDSENETHYLEMFFAEGPEDVVSNGVFVVYQTLNPGAIQEVYAITYDGEFNYIPIASLTPSMPSANSIVKFPFEVNNVVGVSLILSKEFGLVHGIDAVGLETDKIIYTYPNALSGDYTIEAFSKGACSSSQTIEFINYNEFDTIQISSCEAYTYYEYDSENEVIISKSGTYDFKTFGDGCGKFVHLDFTYNGIAKDTSINICDDSYYWEEADMDLYESGIYTYVFYSEETGCDSVVNVNFTYDESPEFYFSDYPGETECMKTLSFATNAYSVKLNGELVSSNENFEGYPVFMIDLENTSYSLDINTELGVCKNTFEWINKVADYDTITIDTCGSYETPNGTILTETGIYFDTIPNEGESSCDLIYVIDYTFSPLSKKVSFVNGEITAEYVSETANYTWYDCDTEESIEGEMLYTLNPPYEGSFGADITDASCKVSTDCFDIISTGTKENSEISVISIYPNPSEGTFNVELISNQNYSLTNSLGTLVQEGSLTTGLNTLNLSGLVEGIYILNINSKMNKLVIKK